MSFSAFVHLPVGNTDQVRRGALSKPALEGLFPVCALVSIRQRRTLPKKKQTFSSDKKQNALCLVAERVGDQGDADGSDVQEHAPQLASVHGELKSCMFCHTPSQRTVSSTKTNSRQSRICWHIVGALVLVNRRSRC